MILRQSGRELLGNLPSDAPLAPLAALGRRAWLTFSGDPARFSSRSKIVDTTRKTNNTETIRKRVYLFTNIGQRKATESDGFPNLAYFFRIDVEISDLDRKP